MNFRHITKGMRRACGTKRLLSAALVTAATVVFAGASANAAVIFQDSFGGSSGTSLVGQSPTTDTGGATWTQQPSTSVSGNFNADGSFNVSSTHSSGDYLSYNIASGNVYALSATLTPTTTGASFVGLSFSQGFLDQGTSLILHPTTTTSIAALTKAATNGVSGSGVALGKTAKIVLDTRPTNWTATYYYDGAYLGNYTYSGSNPTITGVSIIAHGGANAIAGSVSNFELQTVPEPASLALLGIGGLLLLVRRRRSAAC